MQRPYASPRFVLPMVEVKSSELCKQCRSKTGLANVVLLGFVTKSVGLCGVQSEQVACYRGGFTIISARDTQDPSVCCLIRVVTAAYKEVNGRNRHDLKALTGSSCGHDICRYLLLSL